MPVLKIVKPKFWFHQSCLDVTILSINHVIPDTLYFKAEEILPLYNENWPS